MMIWLVCIILVVYSVATTVILLRWKKKLHTLKKELACTTPQPAPVVNSEHEREASYLDKANEAMQLNKTFQKFVPRQFVEHFAKHGGAGTLELGHADEDDVAILFSDIRGFTSLSERLSPQELMGFLNSYFLRMNDPIHHNHGFIDKFIGDAIMALFDHPGGTPKDKAKDAIQAAIDLRKALVMYNSHRDNCEYVPINMGIGIHYGPVIMGTVGSDDRMDTTVIGDSVNIAYRLESLTPAYDADIIVSAQTLEAVGADYAIKTRLLDWVRVKGRRAPIEVYEVLDHLAPEEQEKRLAIQSYITAGLACRIRREWEDALAHFIKARSINPDDRLAQHHIDICLQYQGMMFDESWDGAYDLER
ncbi:adenylate/guanylate cyclase domain-containing protein [Alteromonas sp. C1M14]|uniref:adenylate/guanylate cyclase domain-containing protein n=1 Tax=Alteromonas sp. C1M14 TaxID=2841567 RepID=UPI001C0A1C73|nr:adenylate/guanylate cyclase domain-containing protein [Alteromonas sp. C1M14]MBU2978620.1 adenylate/guanylate cyclase domain-containing protein [Alteromonas sp. C1M14]